MRFNDLVALILESKKIITSPEQYGDPGMRYVVGVILRKYKGKVSREFLDWIKNNLVKVFPKWHYNFYISQLLNYLMIRPINLQHKCFGKSSNPFDQLLVYLY